LKRALALAKGTPLSERMAWGSPRSAKSRSKAVTAISSRVVSRASHMSRKREVCDREGIAVSALAELELALEVGAPQIVGRQGL
jgi:hypothetical protein